MPYTGPEGAEVAVQLYSSWETLALASSEYATLPPVIVLCGRPYWLDNDDADELAADVGSGTAREKRKPCWEVSTACRATGKRVTKGRRKVFEAKEPKVAEVMKRAPCRKV